MRFSGIQETRRRPILVEFKILEPPKFELQTWATGNFVVAWCGNQVVIDENVIVNGRGGGRWHGVSWPCGAVQAVFRAPGEVDWNDEMGSIIHGEALHVTYLSIAPSRSGTSMRTQPA